MEIVPELLDIKESYINSLYLKALEYIPALPYALLVDKWRWEVFDNDDMSDVDYWFRRWNEEWWNLHKQYMNLTMPSNIPYIDSFVFYPTGNFNVVNGKQYLK